MALSPVARELLSRQVFTEVLSRRLDMRQAEFPGTGDRSDVPLYGDAGFRLNAMDLVDLIACAEEEFDIEFPEVRRDFPGVAYKDYLTLFVSTNQEFIDRHCRTFGAFVDCLAGKLMTKG